MKWNDHSYLEGTHALFSPSTSGWEKYDAQRIEERYFNSFAATIGTLLHEEAMWRIKKRVKVKAGSKGDLKLALYKSDDVPDDVVDALDFTPMFNNFSTYVNDAIGFGMDPEVILYSSDLCYGTADTISFDKNFLRIHDLKTGVTPAHIEQLFKYAALFCLEYRVDPRKIQTELRIYQTGDVLVCNPEADEIMPYIDQITLINKLYKDILERRSQYE